MWILSSIISIRDALRRANVCGQCLEVDLTLSEKMHIYFFVIRGNRLFKIRKRHIRK